ncbi:MAG: extracellular solute-binding protein [Actinomycetota bacterium]|nr:extracellular solute-binding protein [Actinomycetota bacterium]
MEHLERPVTRKGFLAAGAAGAAGLVAARTLGSAGRALGASQVRASGVTLNWLTWSDHYFSNQLQKVKGQIGVAGRVQLITDDSDAYIKVKHGGGAWDISSEDALWVPKFYKEGLIVPFDIRSFPVSKQLYPVALDVPFWKAGSNQMGYPFGWSSLQIYYNPKHVTTKPDSYHALLDPKYRKKIVVENQPTDLMAMAGIATGAKHPYTMTTGEISRAKQFLKAFKPNVLKLVSQNPEVVRALTDESAWLTIENIGTDARVKDAHGPLIQSADPKEGLYGWMDAEMLLKESHNQSSFEKFINTMEQAPWIAKNFLANGRPLFNEKAYKILVDTGHKERADRFFYNHPERPLSMTLKGPSGNTQAYIDAFNEVFSG